jgi:hypothetical protein
MSCGLGLDLATSSLPYRGTINRRYPVMVSPGFQ